MEFPYQIKRIAKIFQKIVKQFISYEEIEEGIKFHYKWSKTFLNEIIEFFDLQRYNWPWMKLKLEPDLLNNTFSLSMSGGQMFKNHIKFHIRF